MNGPFSRLYFIQEFVGSQFVLPWTGLFFPIDEIDKLLFTAVYLYLIRWDLFYLD